MKFWERFDQLDARIVYLLMALALVVPVLKPIGMPISINKQLTQPVYDWVESLSPGDIVFFDIAYGGGSDAELNPQLKAWFAHCMMKGVKCIGVAQWVNGDPIAWTVLTQTAAELEEEGVSAEYGVDWVYLGYRAGGVTTWRTMQDDLWGAVGNIDYQKKDLSQLPLMQKIKKWTPETTKGLIIYSAGSPGIPTYTQYFADHQIYVGDVAVQVAGTSNYLRANQVKGILPGLRGAAEYEKLLGRPGIATKLMDAQSLGHAIIVVLVILGNISFTIKRRKKASGV